MPNPARALPSDLYTLLSTAANAFVALVTFYILKYIFELTFHCTCSHSYDLMYLCAPPCIIFFLVSIIVKHQLFSGYQSLMNKDCDWVRFVLEHSLRFVLICLFWLAAVFLDGDWYECYYAKNRMECKDETLSYEKNSTKPSS